MEKSWKDLEPAGIREEESQEVSTFKTFIKNKNLTGNEKKQK